MDGINSELGALEATMGGVTDVIAGTAMPTIGVPVTGGYGAGALAAGTAAGAGTGPPVYIENATFKDDADLDLLLRKTEFAVLAGRV